MAIRSHLKDCYHYLLRLALLIQFTAGAATSLNPISTHGEYVIKNCSCELNLSDRMSEIEAKYRHQDTEITLLKTMRVKDNKIINQLKDRVDQFEASSVAKISENEKILARQKRPFRLAPLNIHSEKENGYGDESTKIGRKFYGPATDCDELGMLGYTLNGFYIVKGKDQSTTSNKIEVVYCRFSQPRHSKETDDGIESRLGYLNIMEKSTVSGVYFYVQRRGEVPVAENGVIRFNRERLNIGGAMNMSTGVFTVPKNGIYFLSFSMSKDGYNIEPMWVYFRINGVKIGTAVAGTGLLGVHAVMQSTLKLKKGDRVDLWKSGYGALEYRSGDPSSHFTGWLLSQE